jgi:hypothetical protein
MKSKSLLIVRLLIIFVVFITIHTIVSCIRSEPIPKNKKAFIGLWRTRSGFQIEIDSLGRANAIPIDLNNPDFNKIDPGMTPEYSKGMFVEFSGDSIFEVIKPTVRAKLYRINKNPYMDGDTCKMVLNSVLFIKQK